MISREELLVQAAAFDLNEADIQRDCVFGWVVSGLFTESALCDVAVLKGGNALRKGYLPLTRLSDDLDFSLPTSSIPTLSWLSSTSFATAPVAAQGSTST